VVIVAGIAFVKRRSAIRSGRIAVLVVGVRIAVTPAVFVIVPVEIGLAGYAIAIGVEVGRVTGIPLIQRRSTIRSGRIAVLVVDGFVLL
jgi:hypothetical protein